MTSQNIGDYSFFNFDTLDFIILNFNAINNTFSYNTIPFATLNFYNFLGLLLHASVIGHHVALG